jgi:hypothetical protein
MCLWTCDVVCIPQNIPGATNAANPYAVYGFDLGTGSITPYMTSGAYLLAFADIKHDGAGKTFAHLASLPTFYGINPITYKKGKYRLTGFDLITNIFLGLVPLFNTTLGPFPANWGTTVGGYTPTAFPLFDPLLKCAQMRFSALDVQTLETSAAWESTLF